MKRFSPSRGLSRVSRRLPLEIKLPLLMSVVLATVLTIVFIVTFTTLRRNAVAAAGERVIRATKQIATVSATTVAANQARYADVGNDSVVRRALRRPADVSSAALQRVLARASMPTDSGMPVELWTADGRRIGFVGNDVRSVLEMSRGRPELPTDIASMFDTTSKGSSSDSMRVGPMYAEDGRVHLWFVHPIRDRKETIGYIAHQRRAAAGATTQRILRELSGDSVTLYYRNADGRFWTNLTSPAMTPLEPVDSITAIGANGEEFLFHEERMGSTPIVVGMHLPSGAVLAHTRRTIRTLLLLSIAVGLAGVFAAWAIGRSATRPLGDMTRAAELLGRGDYSTRVPEKGDVEVRRLAASFNRMAEEVGASRVALEDQTREAKAANNAKSEFLTTMSHELRTPLNAIGGYVELLEMELRGPVTPEQRRDLGRIKTSQQHLLGLISGVLDLSRIEAGRALYDLQTVAVAPFLAGMDELVAPQAAAKSITLESMSTQPDLAVVADREKLRQVILNLLSNATRHTPAHGTITLSAEPRGNRVAIVVQDTGPGIAEEKRELVFEPFVQLDRSLTQTREGLGLGLAISRDLARGMGGDLTVEHRAGTGARFVLVLPRSEVDPLQPEPKTGEMRVVGDRG